MIRALALLLLLLVAGCGTDPVAGGGEILNPPGKLALSGIIRDSSGLAALASRVRAFPQEYDPVADAAEVLPRNWSDTTGADGAFRIGGLDSGRYSLWATAEDSGDRLLVTGLDPSQSQDAARGARLLAPGAVAVAVPDTLLRPGAYLYLPGTPIAFGLDTLKGESQRIVIGGIPAGLVSGIRYRASRTSPPLELVAPGFRVLPGDTVPLDVLPGWPEYRLLRVDPDGASGIAGPVAGYPLLVRLDGAAIDFAAAGPAGRSLRFTRRDGRLLPFEIESWDGTARTAVLWVRIDTLQPAGKTPPLRIHWGGDSSADPSEGQRVFDSTGAWAGVWHFHGAEADAPLRSRDASAGLNPAYVAGRPQGIAYAAALSGNGASLDGSGAALYTRKAFVRPSRFTLSLWFRTDTDSGGRLIGFNRQSERIDTADARDRQLWMDDGGRLHFGIYETGVPADRARHTLSSPGPLNDGAWHHVAAGMSPEAGMVLFVDGAKVGEDPTMVLAQVGTGYWRMGFEPEFTDWPDAPTATYFRGALDEVRVAMAAPDAARARLDYHTQGSGGAAARIEPLP